MPTPTDDRKLQHDIETIAIAASKIRGHREPDAVMLEPIVTQAAAISVIKASEEPDERLAKLIAFVMARMS